MTTDQQLQESIDNRDQTADRALTTADLAGSMTAPLVQQQAGGDHSSAPLFAEGETAQFRSTWGDIQTSFVDEPRQAVQKADELVARCIKRLAEGFAEERAKMEHEWDRGDNVSTEDLRQALRRYRSFFDRLLTV